MKETSQPAIVRSAKERTRLVISSIKKAMDQIEIEIAENDGIYPHNHGRLSMAEVCRRAGVHPITMMGGAQRDTTRPMILNWIKGIANIKGRSKIRNAITRRSDDAKEQFKLAASKFQAMYQVEIPRRDEELIRLRRRIDELEEANRELREQASRGRVVELPVDGKKRR